MPAFNVKTGSQNRVGHNWVTPRRRFSSECRRPGSLPCKTKPPFQAYLTVIGHGRLKAVRRNHFEQHFGTVVKYAFPRLHGAAGVSDLRMRRKANWRQVRRPTVVVELP